MNDFAKGHVVVLGPDEGESFWQPLPSRGYIVNKLTPYNTPYDNFSLGIQVLEPGAHIRRHAHERQHEVLFCYAGEGWAEVDGQRHDGAAGDHAADRPRRLAHGAEHRQHADAPAVDDRAGRARGLVPRHRPPAPSRRGDAAAVRASRGCRGDPGAAAVRAGGVGTGANLSALACLRSSWPGLARPSTSFWPTASPRARDGSAPFQRRHRPA